MAHEGRPGRHRSGGFTLLEVLVALVIFALASGALAQLVQTGFRQSRAAQSVTEAVLLARSLLAEVGAEVPLAQGVQEGESGAGYRWRAEIEPSGLAAADQTLYRVQVSVAWGAPWREQSVVLSTVRLGASAP